MNRKQRRATLKYGSSPSVRRSDSTGDQISQLFFVAAECERIRKFDDAARAYKRVLLLKPDYAEACNNLARVLQTQGKTKEASTFYARALALMPQLLEQYAGICATLIALLPPLGEALKRQAAAWPKHLTEIELLGDSGLAAIAADPLLLYLLQSTPVRDVAFEHLLTSLRSSLLIDAIAGRTISETVLGFACTLARQCFINEYVFATTPEEDSQAERLKRALNDVTASGASFDPIQFAVLAMYESLHAFAFAPALLDRRWTPAIDELLTQQAREPRREIELRDSIPHLTTVDDKVSQRVRQQYEENPYPRWVHTAGQVVPISIDQYLREQFPTSAFTSLGKTDALDMLVAGCGTGQIAIASAQKYLGAHVLAIDLSLSSLCYAKRKTPAILASRIDYAQADILKLATIGRSFDVVDASGVLHHMADPLEGWRVLLSLVRPGGLMHLGFYSATGRSDVVAARSFIAERGFGSTPAEIRRCRQEILKTSLAAVTRFADFFSTSECRDLLFHVQESRLTIPAIKNFVAQHGLRFLGFEFETGAMGRYRGLFAQQGWSMTDLDRWHETETKYPNTFSGMYQFWVQKA
jgi:2-polyprenyl-3-methyl-5-hydroxy-6-metoxy-1,4-benzoquinol methylase